MEYEIAHGVPEVLVGAAADLYAEAFGHYFAVTDAVRRHRRDLIADGLRPQHAFAAVGPGPTLLGVAGYQFGGRKFLDIRMSAIIRRLGWFQGLRGGLLLSYLDRRQRPGQWVMDGIAVAPAARGLGIGTGLLAALAEHAAAAAARELRLDVVDTNPDARRLYERLGFVEVGQSPLPNWLAKRVGFGTSATLVLKIPRPAASA